MLIELLLAKGADAAARNVEGDTPEDLAEDDNCKTYAASVPVLHDGVDHVYGG